MKLHDKRSQYLGIALIVLGLFAVLRLWWLLPTALLAIAGGYFYRQRRQMGRIPEAVQSGLWLVGLAVLFLVDFLFPGILILAGASLLVRGHEAELDQRVQHFVQRFQNRPATNQNMPVPHSPEATNGIHEENDESNKTIRL